MTVVVDPDQGVASGQTLDDVVSRIRRELIDRDDLNTLSQDISEDDTVLSFDHPLDNISRRTLLNLDDEIVYVWSADTSAKTVTVERGYGTPAQSHSVGTLVTSGSRSRKQIIDAVNDELNSLSSSGLYQMLSAPLDYNYAQWSYALPDLGNSNVYDVQAQGFGNDREWRHVPFRYNSLDRTVTLAETPWASGVRVLYQAPFKRHVDGSDDIQVASGLQSEAIDVLVWGACYTLTTGDEYKRNDFRSQGDTRRANEVQYRAVALARNDFMSRHDRRLSEERDRLNRNFPRMKQGW